MKKLMLGAAVAAAIASSGCAATTTATTSSSGVASSERVNPQDVFDNAKTECGVDAASGDTTEAESIANVQSEFDSRFASEAKAGCKAAF
jgi:hypothetical protein